MKVFIAVLGAALLVGISAYAGGLSDAIVEAVPDKASPQQSGGSLPSWVVPALVVTLLVGVAVATSDSDDDGGAS